MFFATSPQLYKKQTAKLTNTLKHENALTTWLKNCKDLTTEKTKAYKPQQKTTYQEHSWAFDSF